MPYRVGSSQKLLFQGAIKPGERFSRIALEGRQPSIYMTLAPRDSPSMASDYGPYDTGNRIRNVYYQIRVLDSIVLSDGYVNAAESGIFIDEPSCFVMAINGWPDIDNGKNLNGGEMRLWYPAGVVATVFCNAIVWEP